MATQVTTGKVRLSYCNIWEPKSINGSDPKYSVSLIIPKSDAVTINKIKQAVKEAIEAGLVSKFPGAKQSTLKNPLRDGDAERPDDENYANSYFLNANCSDKQRPGIVDRNANAILDQSEVYSGCFGRAAVTFYPFNTNGNKGIACGLNHIQKLSDGPALDGRISTDAAFAEPIDDDDDDMFS